MGDTKLFFTVKAVENAGIEILVLSIDQEMIPAMNVIDAHVKDFMVNGELLLSTLTAFTHCPLCLYTPLEMLDVCSLCLIVEYSVAPTDRGPVSRPIASSPQHRARHAPPSPRRPRARRDHLVVCCLYELSLL